MRTALFGSILAAWVLGATATAGAQEDRIVRAAAKAKVSLTQAIVIANSRAPGLVLEAAYAFYGKEDAPRLGTRVRIHGDAGPSEVMVDAETGEIVSVTTSAAGAMPAPETESFEGEEIAGWSVAETNGTGTPGRWSTRPADDARHGRRIASLETQNAGKTFNLLLRDAPAPADLSVSVWLRADAGSEDQGGGVVWRAKDAANYYIARWNPLEKNLRLYQVQDSVRSPALGSAKIEADPKAWHLLSVRMAGPRIEVSFDREVVIEAEDRTFTSAGKVGLWTKADAATSFDLFAVTRP